MVVKPLGGTSTVGILGLLLVAACNQEPANTAPLPLAVAPTEQEQAIPDDMAGQEAPRERKEAECLLWPHGFRGACLFEPRGRGSFSITRDAGEAFFDDVTEVIVMVFDEGKADVRDMKADGESERWGEAARSEGYPACWIGDGFSVCAY